MTAAWRDGWFDSIDGLRLHYRDYGDAAAPLTPAVCLPGLSRNARDFHALAAHLAPLRRVLVVEMRGRGRSARDEIWRNYNILTEVGDILHLLDGLGLDRIAVIGASRGGLQAMLIATLRPGLIVGTALVDVGPRIERAGLLRIVAGLHATPERYEDWAHAADALKRAHSRQFPRLTDAEWEAYARRLHDDQAGVPVRDFDPHLLLATAAAVEDDLPELWGQFEPLTALPLLAVRGENSDLLSLETLAEMARRDPDMTSVTIPDRGHCPFLDEPEAVAAIQGLLERADAWTPPPPEPTADPTPPPSAPPSSA